MAKSQLDQIKIALDQVSYDWLNNTHPELADVLENAVIEGLEPVQIRRLVMLNTARMELALRCEQFARHVARGIE